MSTVQEEQRTGPMFSLYFSDAVTTADNVDRIRDVVEINGIPAIVLNAGGNAGNVCDQTRIDVTLGQTLSAGDVISIDGSSIKLGTSTDQRSFGSATGYAADAPAPGTADVTETVQDRVDENLNGSSQNRIQVSSSVKAPS